MNEDNDEARMFIVLINQEEQYSLWPSGRPIPAGWHRVGSEGSRAACLAYIEKVWVDMRPLTLRRKMNEASAADRRG